MIVLFIISLVISLVALFALLACMYELYNQHNKIKNLECAYDELESNLKPIRLNFIIQSYNLCMRNEEYETAGKIMNIIKVQFPEEFEKIYKEKK